MRTYKKKSYYFATYKDVYKYKFKAEEIAFELRNEEKMIAKAKEIAKAKFDNQKNFHLLGE
jgi:hypothetical protein